MRVKLGEIAEVTKLAGFEFTKYIEYIPDGEIIAIRALNLKNGSLVLDDVRRISRSVSEILPRSQLRKYDIVISYTGTIGECAQITENNVYHLAPNVCKVTPKQELINPDYLFQYIRSKEFKTQMFNYAHGSTQPTIPMATVRELTIPLPSIEVQQRIASLMKPINDKIELNNKINNNLEQQAQAIFKSWFVDFEPFNGTMPSDWHIGTIDELSKDVICGKTPSTKIPEYYGEDIPFITIPDMHNQIYNVVTERYLSVFGAKSQAKKDLPPNSVCVSCIGTAGLVTLTSTVSQTNQQINAIIPKDGFSAYYIYLLMQTLSEKINKLGQSGSTIVNLNKTQFSRIEVLIPSVETMSMFDTITKPIFDMVLSKQQETLKLISTRDTLLPKLMSGEIDLSSIDI